jgi:flagellar hook-basal body complex protein FliE
VDGISNQMGETTLTLSLLKSHAAVSKAAPKAEHAAGQTVGNILESFGGMLKEQMNNINNQQNEANTARETYAVGGDIPLHSVMIAAEKADLSLQLAMQVRNKLVAAYQEISHMSI